MVDAVLLVISDTLKSKGKYKMENEGLKKKNADLLDRVKWLEEMLANMQVLG